MHRLWKHIDRADAFQFIAAVTQNPEITGKRCAVAAHINDPVRGHLKHGIKTHLIAALPWRIHDNHIRMKHAFPALIRAACRMGYRIFSSIEFRQYLFCLSSKELCISDSIICCILLCILNRLWHDFHSIDL